MCTAFIDYEKAFDSVETDAVIGALKDQGIQRKYKRIMRNVYKGATVTVQIHEKSELVFMRRGVRQSDSISPKLFTATLESIFRKKDWDKHGVFVNGRQVNHLRFAVDIALIARTAEEM